MQKSLKPRHGIIHPALADKRVKIDVNAAVAGQPGIECGGTFLTKLSSRTLHLARKPPRKIAGLGGVYRELRRCHDMSLSEVAIDGKLLFLRPC